MIVWSLTNDQGLILCVYKSKNKNALQRGNKEEDHLQQNYTVSKFQKVLQIIHFGNESTRRARSNNKLGPTRYVFEMWNQYLQDRYVSSMSDNW